MCRNLANGGRQCPSHDPSKRNARRRQIYSAKQKAFLFPSFEEKRIIATPYDPEYKTFIEEADRFANSVTDQVQIDSILRYTSHNFEEIRNYLNGKNLSRNSELKIEPEDQTLLAENVAAIDSALSLAEPPPSHRKLYRGLAVTQAHGDISQWVSTHFPLGKTVQQKSYMSTSLNPSVAVTFGSVGIADLGNPNEKSAIPVVFEILSKQGAPLGDQLHSVGVREQEVLLPREAKFKVVGVTHNVKFTYGNSESNDFNRTATRTVIQLIDAES